MSGKHKRDRDRAAEHKAKQRKRAAEGWTSALTGIGETFAQSVARRGGVVHSDQMLATGRSSYELQGALLRTFEHGASKYGGPTFDTVAQHVQHFTSPEQLGPAGFLSRSVVYDHAQQVIWTGSVDDSPMVDIVPAQTWWAQPETGTTLEDVRVFGKSLLGTGCRGRSRSDHFRGVGRLTIGNRVITREIADALLPIVCRGELRVNGNRRMFRHWITNRLAPAIQVANDAMREASDAAEILEAHLRALYETEDLARRRELAMFVDEARAARAAARARALHVLLDVCPTWTAIEWTRQPETYSERAIRINAEYERSSFAGIYHSYGPRISGKTANFGGFLR